MIIWRTFCQTVLVAVVSSVALTWTPNYLGFAPVSDFHFSYPKLGWLSEQAFKTPGQNGQHGLDFSSLWLGSKDILNNRSPYYLVSNGRRAEWARRWNTSYHPFSVWIHQPLAMLTFRNALIAHNIVQITVLLATSCLLLRHVRALRQFPLLAATTLSLLFLTPIGLLQMERGQFGLYTAASYNLLWVFVFC